MKVNKINQLSVSLSFVAELIEQPPGVWEVFGLISVFDSHSWNDYYSIFLNSFIFV